MKPRVCVIGAGVIGLSTAVSILDTIPSVELTLISEKFSPDTTGDVAAGILFPHALGDTPLQLILKWGKSTRDHILHLHNSAEDAGASILSGCILNTQPVEDFAYSDLLLAFRQMTENELAMLGEGYVSGHAATSVMIECWKYLPYLLNKCKSKGAKVIQKKVASFDELYANYDILVNCTGVGSRDLAHDNEVEPIRGQIMRVKAPWLKHFLVVDDGQCFIIPGIKSVVLGGTRERNNWNLNVSETDREIIWNKCITICPSKATFERDYVGLRPARTKVRVELETIHDGNRTIRIIHNYGHGGAGVTLHWGCAQDACQLVHHVNATMKRDFVGLRPGRNTLRLELETVDERNKTIKIIHNYGHGGSGVTLHWGCAQDACQLVHQVVRDSLDVSKL